MGGYRRPQVRPDCSDTRMTAGGWQTRSAFTPSGMRFLGFSGGRVIVRFGPSIRWLRVRVPSTSL